MQVDLIFKVAAIGILVSVLNQLLVRSGREEQAMMTTILVTTATQVMMTTIILVTIPTLAMTTPILTMTATQVMMTPTPVMTIRVEQQMVLH